MGVHLQVRGRYTTVWPPHVLNPEQRFRLANGTSFDLGGVDSGESLPMIPDAQVRRLQVEQVLAVYSKPNARRLFLPDRHMGSGWVVGGTRNERRHVFTENASNGCCQLVRESSGDRHKLVLMLLAGGRLHSVCEQKVDLVDLLECIDLIG